MISQRQKICATFIAAFAVCFDAFAVVETVDCAAIYKELKSRLRLVPFSLWVGGNGRADRPGEKQIPNIDLDGDDKNDTIYYFCPNTGSLEIADACEARIRLSATGSEHEFSRGRFFLFRFKARIYVVASQEGAPDAGGPSDIFSVGPKGFLPVCSPR